MSGCCAVHCVLASAAPILFAGFGVLHSERVEWALAGTAVLFGLLSALLAYRARRPRWLRLLFVAGLAFLITGRVFEETFGSVILITGGVALVVAHLLHLHVAAKRCGVVCENAEQKMSARGISPGS